MPRETRRQRWARKRRKYIRDNDAEARRKRDPEYIAQKMRRAMGLGLSWDWLTKETYPRTKFTEAAIAAFIEEAMKTGKGIKRISW